MSSEAFIPRIKRKRGRPRRDEPREINDFDVSLIQEFQRRPAFYDRGHPQYRNREYLEPQWMEMAGKLGYSVALVKERMLQLRNRYNLEKRRVEALQEQENDPDITSQWVLYDSLVFLSDHIKSRRPYPKTLMSLRPKQSPETDSSDADDYEDTQQFVSNGNTNMLSNFKFQSHPPLQSTPVAASVVATGAANHRQHTEPSAATATRTAIPIFTAAAAAAATNAVVANSGDKPNLQNSNLQFSIGTACGMDKFEAFGQFLASSLIEMNETDALRLVEKFTAELVKSLLAEQRVGSVANGQMNSMQHHSADIPNMNA